LRRGVRPHPHASEPVVSLITWRPQAWERRKSLRVDDRSQRSCCFHAGTSVARDNRRSTSVQPHFFDSCSAAAAGGQERAGQTLFARLATGGRKVKVTNFDSNGCAHGEREAGRRWRTSTATAARTERTRREGEGAASQVVRRSALRGDLRAWEKVRECAGVAGGWRARRISRPVYSKCTGDHTGQKETALWARWGAHRECVEADA